MLLLVFVHGLGHALRVDVYSVLVVLVERVQVLVLDVADYSVVYDIGGCRGRLDECRVSRVGRVGRWWLEWSGMGACYMIGIIHF